MAKFRIDFITNSSSSSFIAVFGVENNKELAEKSKKLFEDNIFTGKYLKENWDELKTDFTSSWCYVDPWHDYDKIEDDKLYFAYWSSEELTEDEDHNQSDGYDNDEVEEHENKVDSELKELKGFILEYDSWQGRDG